MRRAFESHKEDRQEKEQETYWLSQASNPEDKSPYMSDLTIVWKAVITAAHLSPRKRDICDTWSIKTLADSRTPDCPRRPLKMSDPKFSVRINFFFFGRFGAFSSGSYLRPSRIGHTFIRKWNQASTKFAKNINLKVGLNVRYERSTFN